MQICGNNMSADELEIKRIAFFFICGERCFEIRCNPHLRTTARKHVLPVHEKKGSPKFRQSMKVSTLGSSAKLLALETLAYQDFFPK